MKNELKKFYEIDENKAWKEVRRKTGRLNLVIKRIATVAVTAAAFVGLYFGVTNDNIENNKIERIDYGKAYLVTNRGEKIILSSDTIAEGHVSFEKNSKLLKCVASEKMSSIPNKIVVPIGENLKVELCDGTIVHLNSGSVFEYPSNFDHGKREVKLIGEAYFEVEADSTKPFIVSGIDFKIKVTGTKFNINNYEEDTKAEVTLVSGLISFNRGELHRLLKPNDQLVFDKETNEITQNEVNPQLCTSWTEGRIFFKDTPLSEIAIIMERWYGVKINYGNETVSKELFTGEIYWDDIPEQVIRFLTKAGNLHWEVKKAGEVLIY